MLIDRLIQSRSISIDRSIDQYRSINIDWSIESIEQRINRNQSIDRMLIDRSIDVDRSIDMIHRSMIDRSINIDRFKNRSMLIDRFKNQSKLDWSNNRSITLIDRSYWLIDSINQFDRSINQRWSIESIVDLIKLLIIRSIVRSIDRSINWLLIDQSIHQSIRFDWSIRSIIHQSIRSIDTIDRIDRRFDWSYRSNNQRMFIDRINQIDRSSLIDRSIELID